MNCLEFRRIVGAQPDIATPEVVAHAQQCPACARYRQELQQMDQLIHRALKIDTRSNVAAPAALPHEVPVERAVVERAVVERIRTNRIRATSPRRSMQWGLAASVLAAVLAGLFLWVADPRETLAEQIVEHAQEEAGAMVRTSYIADSEKVASILSRSGVRMKPDAVAVSYAQSCPFRGHRVPHLVVQTDAGPVTVLLLAQEKSIAKPATFDESGYSGVIIPAPRGVLAVLGRGAPVEEIAAKVLAAVDYGG